MPGRSKRRSRTPPPARSGKTARQPEITIDTTMEPADDASVRTLERDNR